MEQLFLKIPPKENDENNKSLKVLEEHENKDLKNGSLGNLNVQIVSSRIAANFFRIRMSKLEVEEFWVIALNSRCEVIKYEMLFKGTVDSCFVHPRDIFRFGIQHNAVSLLIGHNHLECGHLAGPEWLRVS